MSKPKDGLLTFASVACVIALIFYGLKIPVNVSNFFDSNIFFANSDQPPTPNSKEFELNSKLNQRLDPASNQISDQKLDSKSSPKLLANPDLKQNSNSLANTGIQFLLADNFGNPSQIGLNRVVILDPANPKLDFKVNLGLKHALYSKASSGFKAEYTNKFFRDLVLEENASLNNQKPVFAINADYIEDGGNPQGYNVSRGVEYSGLFKNSRSSFGISKGQSEERIASIQVGKRKVEEHNYNIVGGNGRFYKNGQFIDICSNLGQSACFEQTSRSMVAITQTNHAIFVVNPSITDGLLPKDFKQLFEGISQNFNLGDIQDGMLFDGGASPSMYYNGEFKTESFAPIGSVFLVYVKQN